VPHVTQFVKDKSLTDCPVCGWDTIGRPTGVVENGIVSDCSFGARLKSADSVEDGVVLMRFSSTATVVIKDFLGHSSVVVTERYYTNTTAALRKAAEARAAG
jgi:hypothetical protein